MHKKLFSLVAFAWIAPISLTTMMTSDAVCDYCNPPCQTDFDACMDAMLPLTTCIEKAESCTCPSPKPKPHHSPKKPHSSNDMSTLGPTTPLGG